MFSPRLIEVACPRGLFVIAYLSKRFAALMVLVLTFAVNAHAQQSLSPVLMYGSGDPNMANVGGPNGLPWMNGAEEVCEAYWGKYYATQNLTFYLSNGACEYNAQYVGSQSIPNPPWVVQGEAWYYQCIVNGAFVANLDPQQYGCAPTYQNDGVGVIENWFCPVGSSYVGAAGSVPAHCSLPAKPLPCHCKSQDEGNLGDPINVLAGENVREEADYVGIGPFPITLSRVYDNFGTQPGVEMGQYYYGLFQTLPPGEHLSPTFSGTPVPAPSGDPSGGAANASLHVSIGSGQIISTTSGGATVSYDTSKWRMNYDRNVMIQAVNTLTATLYRPDNTTRTFTMTNGAWTPNVNEFSTKFATLTDGSGNSTGFSYVNENDETELYDLTGRLLSITNRAGLMQTMHYTQNPNNASYFSSATQLPPLLTSVTDSFGHVMTFSYDNSWRLTGAVDPNGGQYTYSYGTSGNLSSVSYPDGSTRQYLYTDTNNPAALTGIVDENGNQYVSWTYDPWGNVTSSSFAGGVERISVYYSSPSNTTVTDVNGVTTNYNIQTLNNYLRPSSYTQTCGANCSRTVSRTFDGNGNVASRTDYNGNVTTHSYDLTRDLETSRTEASGTTQARTITTQWHPTYRLPALITEPGRITTFNYDTGGNLLTKTVSANGSNRTWTYTYNTVGQILTATGPRTDVNDTTTYAYDNNGNLITITNALGQVTTLSNYDNNGRVGLITDSNGATTTLAYAPRGWLTSKVFTASSIVQTTSYTYDSAGQLLQVTLPDNTTISYTYDPAHRLTNIKDSLGNSITYTLDLMSNRIGETVTDPNGVLTRQISRVYDSLNRNQQVTGAAQ